jgi:citrate synthase
MGIYKDSSMREAQIFRLLGVLPTLAAHILLRRAGAPPLPTPAVLDASGDPLSYTEHFLTVLGLGKAHPNDERPDPRVVRALDTILLVHADHELNCSTAAVRHLASSGVDVYSAVSGATAALYGPLHGGATEAVLRMLQAIGSVGARACVCADGRASWMWMWMVGLLGVSGVGGAARMYQHII